MFAACVRAVDTMGKGDVARGQRVQLESLGGHKSTRTKELARSKAGLVDSGAIVRVIKATVKI